ncbi:MAG TPA: FdhF/YdeP family oxidoreductase [Acidimicrobiales bacterium]|nr:FdhF/YdeP family oxidoreductase [Acidimicrobiales bacterium]
MTRKRLDEDVTEDGLTVGKPKEWAAGVPAVAHSLEMAREEMGVRRSLITLRALNQVDGFDCMSCAWPDPPDRKKAEFCENGAKAVAWEADTRRIPSSFWAEHSLTSLAQRSEYWMGEQGRLVEPVYKPGGSDHYQPIGWDEAFSIVAAELNALDSPDQATFYTSGRTSNEAAYTYQLFVRCFGTNNLPDCSNMCHESTSVSMAETIGVGKATVTYPDFAQADLIVIMGQNPGTNHPRMLTVLEEAKKAGAQIVAVNPLPEAGLLRFKNPQRPNGVVGSGTQLADQFLQIRLGGDMALLQAVSARVLAAEAAAPGTVLDHAFLDQRCEGLQAFRDHLADLDEAEVLTATGLTGVQIDALAQRYLAADRVIVCWAMGLTQHKKAVDTIAEVINLLLLRGNIGKPGAGACPVRGHSNVQGDRTMGIWEQPPPAFLDALEQEFGVAMPRHHGYDVVESVRRMRDGAIKVFFALGGNFVSAVSDSAVTEAAVRRTRLSVQVSTKLNRSHVITGEQALILPTLGRTEIDVQASGPQFVSVEDTVCMVHRSRGQLPPAGPELLSEVAIVSRLASATLGDTVPVDWPAFERDYDTVRDHIARTVPGHEDYNTRVRTGAGFLLEHLPRDQRRFPTPSGRAQITVNALEPVVCPPGRLLLQTIRSHDQFNTTIYGLDDRYRGIHNGRRVVFVNPDDLCDLGVADGDCVDLHSEWSDGVERVVEQFRVVAFPTARGCAAAYFPEANGLVPLDSTAERSNTPTSKAIVVRLEPARVHVVAAGAEGTT